jgi:hypothetical protein
LWRSEFHANTQRRKKELNHFSPFPAADGGIDRERNPRRDWTVRVFLQSPPVAAADRKMGLFLKRESGG